MVKDKKPRTQYNFKFKENEKEEFLSWFDNQDNISSSLRNIIYHMIELYGTNDILDPVIQKQLVKDSLFLESLRGQNPIQVNSQLISISNITKETEEAIHQENAVHQEEAIHQENSVHQEEAIHQKNSVHQEEAIHQKNSVHQEEAIHQESSVHQEKNNDYMKDVKPDNI